MEYLPVRLSIFSRAASLCMVVARDNRIIDMPATITIIIIAIIIVSLNLSFIEIPPENFHWIAKMPIAKYHKYHKRGSAIYQGISEEYMKIPVSVLINSA
jgi:hypothetical protein